MWNQDRCLLRVFLICIIMFPSNIKIRHLRFKQHGLSGHNLYIPVS